MKVELKVLENILEAVRAVIATSNGNTYGLSEGEQLQALRLAVVDLEAAVGFASE